MSGSDTAQVVSTGFAAASACAALWAVWLSRSQSRVAREAFEADTQPLVTDVPRGLFLEETDWHEVSGEITRRVQDKSEISVGTFEGAPGEPVASVSVPVRNVGNGCAGTAVASWADCECSG